MMNKLRMKTLKPLLISVLFFAACLGPFVDAKSSGDFYEEITRLNKVLSEINRKYVEDVDPTELNEAAIKGIRSILDPHTAVFSPKDYDNLKVSTEGEFGGLGITIAIRDNFLTIITPLQGTPAFQMGLQAGDRILKIEGKSTAGITLDNAVEKLRGKIGTDVTITIGREGVPQTLDFTVTRGRIIIHSVPYAGLIQKDIGYIKVAHFSQKTTEDVHDSIMSLKKQGMKKLILDMRFNPGGLLNQAIEVSELFLDKGNNIVSTKGRTQKTESLSSRQGILPKGFPLAVLINEGSASASEIVAGAIQDWDRGVVIGKTSFGKGSVQTIFPLDNQGNALKLTTAFYYLPMGRCINKPENDIKGNGNGFALSEDEESESDTKTETKDTTAKEVYYTNKGRIMYGGGGISPDVEVDPEPMKWIVQLLERQSQYFKFAIKYRPVLEASGASVNQGLIVSDSIVEAFRNFLKLDTLYTQAKSNAQATAEVLKDILIREQNYRNKDTINVIKDAELKLALDELNKVLENAKNQEFDKAKEDIRNSLKREFLTAVLGEQDRIAHTLKSDAQVLKAIDVLSKEAEYKKLLAAPVTQKK
jgi:carboxyl-terminal processing protease